MNAPKEPVRLSKLMSERGLASRREADELIRKGWVMVNGVIMSELGTKVLPDVEITLLEPAEKSMEDQKTFILYKPVGWVSAQPEKNYRAAVSLLTAENRWSEDPVQKIYPKWANLWIRGLAPAGRLDIDSEGLLLMSQNGRLVKKIIGPDSRLEKEYLVRFEGNMDKTKLRLLEHGLELDGKKLRPAQVELIDSHFIKLILCEGRKRQVRRMMELVNLQVMTLKRVRIGNLTLGALPKGKWRLWGPGDHL